MTRVVGEVERHKVTDRQSWLALRMHDLTASDIGAAAGLDPHKSQLQLYAEKTGLLMPAADNKMMRRGRWLEPAVIEAMREEHPEWRIMQPKVYLRDPVLRLGATPDALVDGDGPTDFLNCQCKVVSRPVYERDWSDGPPVPYLLQTLTEGLLLGAKHNLIAALVIDTFSAELYLHDVPRHEQAEQRVIQIALDFWQAVQAGVRPKADPQRDNDTLQALYPHSTPEPVLDLTRDNMLPGLLDERERIKELVKDGERDLVAIDTEIKDKLGPHERAQLPGWKLSWKSVDYKEFTVPAATRRSLRVTKINEDEA